MFVWMYVILSDCGIRFDLALSYITGKMASTQRGRRIGDGICLIGDQTTTKKTLTFHFTPSLSLLISLQRAHQTSTRMATSSSSGCLAPTPTTRRSPYVKPPSIIPSLASTAAAVAACLSSAGPCPSLSSCLCRAGPGWPPDPPLPHAPCLCPRPWASGKAFASLLVGGGCCLSLSLCVWGSSDWGEVSGSCVC